MKSLRVSLLVLACVLSLALLSSSISVDAAKGKPIHESTIRRDPTQAKLFNTQNKRHAVSRSSYHTERGEVVNQDRAYEGQGTSHIRNALKESRIPLEKGRHLWEPDVYQHMQKLAEVNFNRSAGLLTSIDSASSGAPEQVKLSVTKRANEMVVNWLTWTEAKQPTVQWGVQSGSYGFTAQGSTVTFVDPNPLHLIRYIHNALLVDLPPSTLVYYIVGDSETNVWSKEMVMLTQGNGKTVQTLGVFGDMGVVNARTMKALSDEVDSGAISMVLHLGDYGYNMDELEGMTGDVFLEELSNITSRVPYQGAPGNHEQAYNFSHYANKFSNYNFVTDPEGKPDQNWWFSWDYFSGGSKIHVLNLNSELYYWDYFSATENQRGEFSRMMADQWNWIVDDLTKAYDSGEYDWIFAYSHRPFYCSNTDDIPDCTHDAAKLRKGIPSGPNGEYQWGIETALSVRPIDLYMSAHEHSYERTLPVKNGTIDFQKDVNKYIDPKYPAHIITGSGGCREYYDYFDEVFYGAWSVFRSASYGYGHLTVYNSTHLYWDQIIDEDRAPRDTMWIIKKSREEREKERAMEKLKDEVTEAMTDLTQSAIDLVTEKTAEIEKMATSVIEQTTAVKPELPVEIEMPTPSTAQPLPARIRQPKREGVNTIATE